MKSLRRKVYRHPKVLSIEKAINPEISHECGSGRSLLPLHVVHTPPRSAVKVEHWHSMASRNASHRCGSASNDYEKLLPCATFTRSSNRSGWVPGKKTHQTLATRRAYTRIILGHAAHHLPDRRFIRSVRSAHVLACQPTQVRSPRCQSLAPCICMHDPKALALPIVA